MQYYCEYVVFCLVREGNHLGFEEQKDSDEIAFREVGLEVVDFAYGAS